MTDFPERKPEKDIEQIVQQFVDAQLRGENPNIDEFVKQYPGLEERIKQRIHNLREIDGLFASLMQPDDSDFQDTPAEHDLIGQKLGDFEIVKLIGRGGMGAVFLARQISLDRDVALKVVSDISGARGKSLERFKREAKVLAKISHPNIVPIYEVGEQGPYSYFAMEHVKGVSLDKILTSIRNAKPGDKASDIMHKCLEAQVEVYDEKRQTDSGTVAEIDTAYIVNISKIIVNIASALDYAHKIGILHRDVKPSNILIDSNGTPKLVDFGLARVETQQTITISGEFFGTPNYVSPEQINKPESVDCRSDVYSLAAAYYECLTLHPPFEGNTVNETLTRVISREAIPPKKYCPRLSTDFNMVLLHALEKSPQDRYQNASDFAADIENVLEFKPITAKRPSITKRTFNLFRRNLLKTAVIATALILLAATCVIAVLYIHGEKASSVSKLYAKATSQMAARNNVDALKCLEELLKKNPTLVEAAWLAGCCCQELGDYQKSIPFFRQALKSDPNCARAYQGLGDSYRVLGKYQDAIDCYTKSIAIEPNNLPAHGNLGMAYETLEKYPEAIESYKYVLKMDPNNAGTILRLSSCYYRSRRYVEAEDSCKQLLRLRPYEPGAYGMLASAQKELGKFDDAVKTYERATAIDPNFASMYFVMGVYYQQANRHKEAVILYEKALQNDPNNNNYKLVLGTACQASGLYPKAITAYREYLDCNQVDAATYRKLGYCLTQTKQLEEAIEAYKRSTEIEPNNSIGYSSIGWCYWEFGKYQFAIENCKHALILDQNNLDAMRCIGDSYSKIGDYDTALEFLERVVSIDPNNYIAYSNLAGTYLGKGMYEAAANATEKYLESDPNNFVAQMSLAITYSFLNRQEDSVRAVNRAIEIEPNNAHAYTQRGVSYQVLGNHEKAIDDFKKSIKLDPNQSDISRRHVLIADSLRALHNYNEAITFYKKAGEIDPCDADVWYGLGFCHAVLSQLQKASEYYEKAIKLDPNYFEAYRDLSSVYEKLSLYDFSIKNAIKAMQLNSKEMLPTICINAWGYNLSNYSDPLERYIQEKTKEPNDEIGSIIYYCLGESKAFIHNTAKAKEAYQKAQELYKKLLKANPSNAYALWGLGSSYYRLGEYKNAIELYVLVIKADPNFTASYSKLAFLYATCPQDEFRNGQEAVNLAQKACELTDSKNDVCLSVLAAAYAETGDFEKAVEYQKKAIELADDLGKKEYEKRLEAYKAKKPWRE